jgi:hypothetical protein
VKRPVERIVTDLGQPGLIDALATQLSGADFTTWMLEVMQHRAAAAMPATLLQRYRSDRFVTLATAPFASLRRVETALLDASRDEFETVTLAPLVPLGTHSAIATVAQNKVVATMRHNEVAVDPTNALALEAATRRRGALSRAAKSQQRVALAALQRVVRAQSVSSARHFAHFELFGLVSAGRDSGSFGFEKAAAVAHLSVHVRGLRALGANTVQIALTDFSGGELRTVSDACRDAFDGAPDVVCRDDPDRAAGAGYYQGLCFKVHAAFGEEPLFETSDGGIVDWTQRLVGSAKERCFISGIGIDRLALAIAPP